MLNLDVISRLRTANDIRNLGAVAQGYKEEYGYYPDEMFDIVGTDFPHLRYNLSTLSNNGYIIKNYFTTKSADDRFGLVEMKSGRGVLKQVVPSKYLEFTHLNRDLFLAFGEDNEYDLYYDDTLLANEVVGYDVLTLGDKLLYFFQIDFVDSVGLVCCDNRSASHYAFVPEDCNDFLNWFNEKLERYGSQGYLDDYPFSVIQNIKMEVVHTIFGNTPYQKITTDLV